MTYGSPIALTSQPALRAERVRALFAQCEAPDGGLDVQGVVHSARFDKAALEYHKAEIGRMLRELPRQFHHDGGGGWSFLNACNRDDGEQWTGEHRTVEQLLLLGIATEQARLMFNKDMWQALPGGMPYFVVDPA